MFGFYLHLGITHILDISGYDHILFIAAMVAVYTWKEWKHVIVLATAFTIGHSTTLALATLRVINVPSTLIEFLIAVTIFLTGIANLFKVKDEFSKRLQKYKYLTAMFFGLIHGLGFSNYLRYLLGKETNIVMPLFAFNIGLEFGQIVVITIVLFMNYLLIKHAKVPKREWNLVISGMAIGISLMLMIERGQAMAIGT
jgi:ABC-type antimicrobial peptide transport system permease subunit